VTKPARSRRIVRANADCDSAHCMACTKLCLDRIGRFVDHQRQVPKPWLVNEDTKGGERSSPYQAASA
jgi:hypothetical protein